MTSDVRCATRVILILLGLIVAGALTLFVLGCRSGMWSVERADDYARVTLDQIDRDKMEESE
jgi:hypothetical protein